MLDLVRLKFDFQMLDCEELTLHQYKAYPTSSRSLAPVKILLSMSVKGCFLPSNFGSNIHYQLLLESKKNFFLHLCAVRCA